MHWNSTSWGSLSHILAVALKFMSGPGVKKRKWEDLAWSSWLQNTKQSKDIAKMLWDHWYQCNCLWNIFLIFFRETHFFKVTWTSKKNKTRRSRQQRSCIISLMHDTYWAYLADTLTIISFFLQISCRSNPTCNMCSPISYFLAVHHLKLNNVQGVDGNSQITCMLETLGVL